MKTIKKIINKLDKLYTNICINIYFKAITFLHLEDELIYK